MAATLGMVDGDWTITRSTGAIRYIGNDHVGVSPSYATVIQFHRWMQDFADDAVSVGDDELDITDDTPSNRSTDNIITLLGLYNIDDAASEHLYDGSIIQGTGGTEVIYDGIVNFGNTITIQMLQSGVTIVDDWWNNDPFVNSLGLNSDPTSGISHRFMIKTRTAGADLDARKLIGLSRTFNKTYAEFSINATARGNNVLALSESNDVNNQQTSGDVATWTTIDNLTVGFKLLDVNNDTTDEEYYSEWDEGVGGEANRSGTINDIYERTKYLTRDGEATTLYGLPGEDFRGITHQVDMNTAGTNSLTFNAFEPVSWSGGTGQMLAHEGTTAATMDRLWIQLLTGAAPGNAVLITGVTSTATATSATSAATTVRPVSVPFIGASTGSALIGGYGVGIQTADLASTDLLLDLSNTVNTPPNNVVFSVEGLVVGEDYVLVTHDAATAINENQFALATALVIDNVTTVVIGNVAGDSVTIPTDTPATGTIRVIDNAGAKRKLAYTGYTTTNFTGITGAPAGQEDFLGNEAAIANLVYITYLDKLASATTESFTVVFDAQRTLYIRVRDGGTAGDAQGIKTFETTASLGSGGGSTTVIRTADV
jgi:hypothetical protein